MQVAGILLALCLAQMGALVWALIGRGKLKRERDVYKDAFEQAKEQLERLSQPVPFDPDEQADRLLDAAEGDD